MTDKATTALVTIPSDSVYAVFTEDGRIDAYLDEIRQHIASDPAMLSPDITTSTGRKSIISLARKVASSKTYLDDVGKELTTRQKEIPKKIDVTCRHLREKLDELRDTVREPVTEWEAKEASRKKAHEDRIHKIEMQRNTVNCSASDIEILISYVDAVQIDDTCEEFIQEYTRAKTDSLVALRNAFDERVKQEDAEAELAVLRQEKAERDEEDRKREQVERKKKEDEHRQNAIAANALKETEKKLEALQREKEQERVAAEAREADILHRKTVEQQSCDDLQSFGGLTTDQAADVVAAISDGKIRSISLAY